MRKKDAHWLASPLGSRPQLNSISKPQSRKLHNLITWGKRCELIWSHTWPRKGTNCIVKFNVKTTHSTERLFPLNSFVFTRQSQNRTFLIQRIHRKINTRTLRFLPRWGKLQQAIFLWALPVPRMLKQAVMVTRVFWFPGNLGRPSPSVKFNSELPDRILRGDNWSVLSLRGVCCCLLLIFLGTKSDTVERDHILVTLGPQSVVMLLFADELAISERNSEDQSCWR